MRIDTLGSNNLLNYVSHNTYSAHSTISGICKRYNPAYHLGRLFAEKQKQVIIYVLTYTDVGLAKYDQ